MKRRQSRAIKTVTILLLNKIKQQFSFASSSPFSSLHAIFSLAQNHPWQPTNFPSSTNPAGTPQLETRAIIWQGLPKLADLDP
jgi:hypothetical protein